MEKKVMNSSGKSRLYDQLLKENIAMAEHALAAGMKVPPRLLQMLEAVDIRGRRPKKEPVSDETLSPAELKNEQNASLLPFGDAVSQLTLIHERLARIVEPARPGSILLIAQDSNKASFWRFLGPLPLVRQMMFMAMLSTTAFIFLGLSSVVRSDPNAGNVLTSFGWDLLGNELFFMAAAGVGASFAALFRANRYIVEGTFDLKYQSSYWILFVLGLISGLILACLIPIESRTSTLALSKPLLALLGGFASTVVYRVLTRLVSAVETLISGETRDIIAAQVQESKARFAEQAVQNRLKIAADLVHIQRQMQPDDKPEAIREKIDNILNELLPLDAESIPLLTAPEEK